MCTFKPVLPDSGNTGKFSYRIIDNILEIISMETMRVGRYRVGDVATSFISNSSHQPYIVSFDDTGIITKMESDPHNRYHVPMLSFCIRMIGKF